MSIPGAVHFVTIAKALLPPVQTHVHQHTHMHTHTHTPAVSLSQGHVLTWEWFCLIVTNLPIWRDFPPSVSLLSCFLPELLCVELPPDSWLRDPFKEEGLGEEWIFTSASLYITSPAGCSSSFHIQGQGPDRSPHVLLWWAPEWPPWMASTAGQQWFLPSPMSTTLSFCTSPSAGGDQCHVHVLGNPLVTGSTYFLLNFLFPPPHILPSFRQQNEVKNGQNLSCPRDAVSL